MSNPDGTLPEHPVDIAMNLARQHQERADRLEAIVRKMLADDENRGGCFDTDLGVVDVQANFTEDEKALINRLRRSLGDE
jgi:hypothetical protein